MVENWSLITDPVEKEMISKFSRSGYFALMRYLGYYNLLIFLIQQNQFSINLYLFETV